MRVPKLVATCRLAELIALTAILVAFGGGPATGQTNGEAAPPEEIRWPSSVGEVVFPHQMHVDDVGATCDTCHHETVAPALAVPHPDYFDDFWVDCKTCHNVPSSGGRQAVATSGHRCVSCHPERTASGPKVEMPTVKVAIHTSCWKCHEEGRGAEASAQCGVCHQRPAHAPTAAAVTGDATRATK